MTDCPMCKRPVPVPELDELIRSRRIKGHAAAILTALWDAGGAVVPTQRIFDRMYEDDIDGGPSNTQMYTALNRGLKALKTALAGSGVSVVATGKGKGTARGTWRLTITGT